MTETSMIPLRSFLRDPRCQPREGPLDDEHLDGLRDALEAGRKLPPIVVYRDLDGTVWLSEGFHRCEAYAIEMHEEVMAEVREGELEDAIVNAMASNASHGLKRSKGDLGKALRRMFQVKADWSDKRIAAHVQCSNGYVSERRREYDKLCTDTQVELPQPVEVYSTPDSVPATPAPVLRTGTDGKERSYVPKPYVPPPPPPVYQPRPMPTFTDHGPVRTGSFDWKPWTDLISKMAKMIDAAGHGTQTHGSDGMLETLRAMEDVIAASVTWREAIQREARR